LLAFRHVLIGLVSGVSLAAGSLPVSAQESSVAERIAAIEPQVIAWRRDFHEHPELGNRETRTAGIVAAELERLGLEVRTGIAHTGVLGVLRGGRPGPTVALRADMDALPVTENSGLPFASKVRTTYRGQDVGVMHACGHDAHTAILLGVAQVLAEARRQVPGTVLFVFQPAEEGAPAGERGGAKLMLEEGAFDDPKPDAAFALHVVPQHEAGEIALLSGGAMAGSNRLEITVRGRQTHAAYPWAGIDPVAVASRIVLALQAIPGRQMDARRPTVVSIGSIHGGVRHNIIPDEVTLLGTIRHLDPSQRDDLFARIRRTATKIGESAGAEVTVEIPDGYPITYNDLELTKRARPVLERIVGPGKLVTPPSRTGAEDFSFFANEVPGVYFWLGIRPPDVTAGDAAANHSPLFHVDESALVLGVRALTQLVLQGTAQE
jgi:amidohydrolase